MNVTTVPVTLTTRQIAAQVGGELTGPPDLAIIGLAQVEEAAAGQLVLLQTPAHAGAWPASHASAALVGCDVAVAPDAHRALIRVADFDAAMIALLRLFQPSPARPQPGIHPSAVVDSSAHLESGVAVGPHCFIGPRARIGAGCILHPRVTIMDDVIVGSACELYPGAVVRERCALGRGVIVHPNAVIGADGFGFRPASDGRSLVKVPQIGTVRIGDDVEIGAGTCIDRGTFGTTIIGSGTKIDNLCQIGHNCRIGRACAFAAQVGIAGSTTVGDGVMMGGKAGIRDHLTVGAGAQIAAYAAVMNDVPPGARWAGYPAMEGRDTMRQVAAVRALPALLHPLRALLKGRSSGSPEGPDRR
jgi:UDP-3-O-[3-hydroxymyristoyl] glucosamine N-acyltransferase